ncbi:MAG: hypothetical protein C0606_11385 [Hyphomicrobiales bacterium]|nr:MAG: hypothetical protein C0606_11385 [Hyphomicrobiales bacterium]
MIVREWLRRIEGASVDTRVEAVCGLAEVWLKQDLEPMDRDDVEAALTLALDDPAVRVRAALAEALVRSPLAPRHVMLTLANDQPEIAAIVLQRSPVLRDRELVDIIAIGDTPCQSAVAARPYVSPALAAALAEVGSAEAVSVLADNPGAEIGHAAMMRLTERHGGDARLRSILLARPDLPVSIRQMLIAQLGSQLGAFAVDRFSLGSERADRCVRDACDKATVTLAAEVIETDMDVLVAHLRSRGQLTTALLLRALCTGNMRFVETAMAQLSGVPVARVFAIMADGRVSVQKALFGKAGLPKAAIEVFALVMAVYREMALDGEAGDTPRFSRRMIERVLTRYEHLAPANADKLLVLLRRFASEAARDAARERLDMAREELRIERTAALYLESALEEAA